jgi:hypothetical protein
MAPAVRPKNVRRFIIVTEFDNFEQVFLPMMEQNPFLAEYNPKACA